MLLPDDPPEIFYEKLTHESHLEENVQRFEKYEQYCKLLKFFEAASKRPEMNIRLVYNDRYGWHISSCFKSVDVEDANKEPCTCQEDIANPDIFFLNIQREVKKLLRCKVCKHFTVDWENIFPRETDKIPDK